VSRCVHAKEGVRQICAATEYARVLRWGTPLLAGSFIGGWGGAAGLCRGGKCAWCAHLQFQGQGSQG
jgi:hypothetical protein